MNSYLQNQSVSLSELVFEKLKTNNRLTDSPETDEKLIVLFGSYAKNLAKKDSDIDIYIETKNRNIKKVVEEIHPKINVKIGPFDLKSPLIREIIKDHVIIRGLEEFHGKK